jgi:hypothetical protein
MLEGKYEPKVTVPLCFKVDGVGSRWNIFNHQEKKIEYTRMYNDYTSAL